MSSALTDGDRAVRSLEGMRGAALLAVLFRHLAWLGVSRVADTGEAVVVQAAQGHRLSRTIMSSLTELMLSPVFEQYPRCSPVPTMASLVATRCCGGAFRRRPDLK